MPSLHMGPDTLRFEVEVIDRVVTEISPGNYALGLKDEAGEFVPKYVGRSDFNLNAELKKKRAELNYPYFKFSYSSPREAYDMECSHFHIYRAQLDNAEHPLRPAGSQLSCFLCGQ